MRRAVFLDRDGTLIREVGYLSRLEDLEVLPGVAAALARLAEAGYLRILVTNQSGVARGFFSQSFVDLTHEALRERLRAEGADIEAVYSCPHHPDFTGPCPCRKPMPGMVLQAAQDWGVDLATSWVVGDKASDVELAKATGSRSALVRTGCGREAEVELARAGVTPDVIAEDLRSAAEEMVKP